MGNIINKEAVKAYKHIQKGGVILYPTDTIWGLGCDATNCVAVEKIYSIKKRNIKPWGNDPLLLSLRGFLGTIALICIFFVNFSQP